MSFKFNLGDEVKTKVTGYKGIIRARADHLTGCNTYGIQNQKLDKEGVPRKNEWFDEDEIILIKAKKVVIIEEKEYCKLTEAEKAKAEKVSIRKRDDRGGPRPEDQIPRR